jgi:hypothetical protein
MSGQANLGGFGARRPVSPAFRFEPVDLGPCCIEADLLAMRYVIDEHERVWRELVSAVEQNAGPRVWVQPPNPVQVRIARVALERLERELERRLTWRERLARWWASCGWNAD